MRISMGIGHEPSLQRLVIASVVLHFILMAFLFIPFKTGDKEFKTYYVSLAEPAKVSGGGETAARKAEEKPAAKKEASAAEKKIDKDKAITEKINRMAQEVDNSRKAAETVDKEIERLRAIKALSEGKEEREKTRAIDIVRSEASAKGTGGTPGKGVQIASDSYYAEIIRKIQDEYVVPPNFDSAGVEVVLISINIDSKGKVVGFPTIEKSSGNILFDQAALKAITKASPLPPPPPLVEMPIGLRFYP